MYRRIVVAVVLAVAAMAAGAPLAGAADAPTGAAPTLVAHVDQRDPGPPVPRGGWHYHHWNHDHWDDDDAPGDFCKAHIVIYSEVYCDVDVDRHR